MEGQLTADKLKEFIKDFHVKMLEETGVDHSKDGVTHNQWVDRSGREHSSWTIRCGNTVMETGDGGMELYEKALRDALKA